jgi:hypothetical protein
LGQLDVTRASHEVEKRREPQARFRKQASRTVREHNPFASATFLAILVRGHIHLKPGWDAPIDIDQFLTGEF